MIKFTELLAKYPRLAITGAPRTGKSTLVKQVTDRPVVATDDYKELPWPEVPHAVKAECEKHPSFCVEGVMVPRALRKGLVVDAVLYLETPKVEQTKAQEAMGRGIVGKVFSEWWENNTAVQVFSESEVEFEAPAQVTADSKVARFTTWTLDSSKIERTTQGGIRVPARLTKVGVFEYNRDGKVVREYRPPEEVFASESLASLRGCTVVVNHPYAEGGEVTPENYRRLNVGHVEDPQRDGDTVVAWLVINDASTIRDIDAKKLKEISCGYDNVRDYTPGVTPEGEAYVLVQRLIVYNHVALGPEGWGRQGPDIGLTLDANDNQVTAVFPRELEHIGGNTMPDDPNKPAGTPPVAGAPAKPTNDQTPVAPAPLTPEELTSLKALAQAAPALLELVKTGSAPAPAPAAAAPVAPTADAGVAKPDEATKTADAADAEVRVQDTVELRESARKVLGETFSFAGKTNRDIRVAVVKTLDSAFDPAKVSDDQLRGSYEFALKLHEERAKGTAQLAQIQRAARGATLDSSGGQPPAQLGDSAYYHNQQKQAS